MQAGLGKKLAEPSAALPQHGVAERFARFVQRHPGGRWKILDNLWRSLVKPGEANATMSVRLNARASLSRKLEHGAEPVERLLVWAMAAHDLGAISRIGLLERMESLLADCSVARSHEHETPPETGNLAAFLRDLPLRCYELSLQPMFDKRVLDGLSDTLLLMKSELKMRGHADAIRRDISEEIENCLVHVRSHRKADARSIDSWASFLNSIRERAAVIEGLCSSINVEGLRLWVDEFSRQAKELHYDIQLFAPWTSVNTLELDSIIRNRCPSLFPLWSHINKALEPIPIISLRPERLAQLLPEVALLRCELERTPPIERDLALRRCDELIHAIESALRVASDIKLRYEDLIHRLNPTTDYTDCF